MTEQYYSKGRIVYTRAQIHWLLKLLPDIRQGYWPQESSGYTDMPITKKRGRPDGYFVDAVLIATELETRLERCGLDGLILEAILGWDKTEEAMANYLRCPVWSIKRRMKNALSYVSGKARKTESYKQFLQQKTPSK
ncbi:hypothetical protein ES708_29224 [subsurface metagenome]